MARRTVVERRASSLPAVLKRLRDSSGMTQKALGVKIGGLNEEAIRRFETGDRIPSWRRLGTILAALDQRDFLFLTVALRLHLKEHPQFFFYRPELKAFYVFSTIRKLYDEKYLQGPPWLDYAYKLRKESENFGVTMGLDSERALAIYDECNQSVDPESAESKMVASIFTLQLERWAAHLLGSKEIDFAEVMGSRT